MTAVKNRDEALKEAARLPLERENGVKRGGYAAAVYLAFGEIERLKEMRISLAEIREALESTGLLPANASQNTFRNAYRREKARRLNVKRTTLTLILDVARLC